MSKTRAQPRAQLGSTGVFQKPNAIQPIPDVISNRPDRAGRTAMPFWVPIAARKQLRMMAAEMDKTQQDLMTMALNDFFEKYGKPRIA